VSKLIGLVCAAMLLLLSANHGREQFAKYKPVEAYEIRPGILMMPRYSADGQVCEIVIEKHHYSNDTAILGSTIPRELIIQIVDELVPINERGPLLPTNLGREYLALYGGNSYTAFADYKNVSIDIAGNASPIGFAGDIVATIHWKNLKCQ
jgi:hypothetical protein